MNYPAIWSAVAATFSALSAVMVMLVQRRNLFESVRPELVPIEWSRRQREVEGGTLDEITFKKLRNVGRGTAFNVAIQSEKTYKNDEFPTLVIHTNRFPIIAPNEAIDVNQQVFIFWKNIKPAEDGAKFVFMNCSIACTNSMNHRFTCYISALIDELTFDDEWISRVTRSTTHKAIWRLNLESWSRVRSIKLKGLADRVRDQMKKLEA